MRPLLLALLLVSAPAFAVCPDGSEDDCDGDGFATSDGDCDDEDPTVHPGAFDGCNGIDDDCNGTVDEDCDEPLKDASLGGGSACDAGRGGGGPWLLGLLALGLRWRSGSSGRSR